MIALATSARPLNCIANGLQAELKKM